MVPVGDSWICAYCGNEKPKQATRVKQSRVGAVVVIQAVIVCILSCLVIGLVCAPIIRETNERCPAATVTPTGTVPFIPRVAEKCDGMRKPCYATMPDVVTATEGVTADRGVPLRGVRSSGLAGGTIMTGDVTVQSADPIQNKTRRDTKKDIGDSGLSWQLIGSPTNGVIVFDSVQITSSTTSATTLTVGNALAGSVTAK